MSNDGRWLVTGSADGTCQIWGFSEQGPESTAVVLRGHQGRVSSLAISPDNKLLASAGEDSSVFVWHLQLEDLIKLATQDDLKSTLQRHSRSVERVPTGSLPQAVRFRGVLSSEETAIRDSPSEVLDGFMELTTVTRLGNLIRNPARESRNGVEILPVPQR